VYRLGWYAGVGARLVGCTPSCSAWNGGQVRSMPAPDAGGLVSAGWPVTDFFALPSDAVSGYYLVRFVLATGPSSSTLVIVRAPPGQRSAILVQVPVNTWQAYNSWGGSSLYNQAGLAVQSDRVSFDRPYVGGADHLIGWEYPMVLFLERSGYDVSYQTDAETDANPSSLLGHRLVISLGHDEYWTGAMRQAFEAARDAGVNLAFMGANDVYWHARYEDGGRTLAVHKSRTTPDPAAVNDPSLATGLFRVLQSPECQLVGIQHQGGALTWGPGDYAVVPAALGHPWFQGTGFDTQSVLTGLVSVETDTIPQWDGGASCGHKLTVFFHHEAGGDQLGNADTTAYTAPSGATVFAAGSLQLVWGLADPPPGTGLAHGLVDPRLQRFVQNMLDDLSAQHVADLDVALSMKRAKIAVGETFTLRALITNKGPDPASAVTLDLALSPEFTFVRVASAAVKCTIRPLQCTLAQLLPGAPVTVTFTLRSTTVGTASLAARAFTLMATDPNPATATGKVVLVVTPHTSLLRRPG
jgi:uncharacterized repeat protein (TIGR01451 family)